MRLQLALNVDNLDASIEFYTKMFDTPPAKIKPGYANFAIENPPLKLVLFEGEGPNGTINHLGVETETAAEVAGADARLTADGLATTGVEETVCCFANKTETWLEAPDGNRWEWYVKLGDADQVGRTVVDRPVVDRIGVDRVIADRALLDQLDAGGDDVGSACCPAE